MCPQKSQPEIFFFFFTLIQANCGIAQRQRTRSRDERPSNGPSQTSYSPPPSGNCVSLLLSFYLYNLMTAREYQHSISEEHAWFSPSFFFLQWIRPRQLEFQSFHITLLSAFSVTPLLWGGVPAPLSPAVRPRPAPRAPLPP